MSRTEIRRIGSAYRLVELFGSGEMFLGPAYRTRKEAERALYRLQQVRAASW